MRGIGGERATVWGQSILQHTAEANDAVLVVPIVETVATLSALPAMCQVDGVELFLFGPADLSSTAGHRGQWEGPGVAEKILQAKETIRAAGKSCGLLTRSEEDLAQRRASGFQFLGLGSDAGLMLRSLRQMLRAAGRDRNPATSLDPQDSPVIRDSLPKPPEGMRPDRAEVITRSGSGPVIELQTGVQFEALVGSFNTARNLTTGVVTFQPGASLDAHTHPFGESITVLTGIAEVSVEGRSYLLGPLDNIVIPRWAPHAARNPDAKQTARLHIALASSSPDRELVARTFPAREMPADSTGTPGMERVTRIRSAPRSFSIGPGAEFVDYFNAELVPGLEMSGGYGKFQPGGRLPAHVHDFDESICIVGGDATCLVEGRRYALGDCATAMVPRGRVHYFINESQSPMEMIWVYAGPMPERIVVDAACVTEAGNPWK
jgi:quercetin dioxygenase-like cupin family protein